MKPLLKYNLRDLGGMPTTDGHCVRHNRFLRSANLQALTHRDQHRLLQSGLTTILDLRTPIEIEEKPDVQINGVENIAVPILSDQSMGITREHGADPIQAIRSMRQEPDKLRAMLPDFCKLYEGMVTSPSSQAGLAQALNHHRLLVARGMRVVSLHRRQRPHGHPIRPHTQSAGR